MVATGPASLSSAQRDVISHPLDRPGVVDAGAGTGKTFTIVERVAALHESGECPADRILLLTFGRKAAAELRARIARRLGEAAPDCLTFHAFAWAVLSSHLYDIGLSPETAVIEDVEARVEFKTAFDEFMNDPQAAASGFPLRVFNRDELRDGLFTIRQNLKQQGVSVESFRERALAAAESFGRTGYRELRKRLQRARKGEDSTLVAQVSDEQLTQEVSDEKARVLAAADVFARFDRRLADRHALTYADILVRAENALVANPALRDELRGRYRCCIVDEYQDTDLAQHRFLTALFGSALERVMVVGDVLQSIYSFRGARPGNVDAIKAAPGAITYPLHENRRSLQAILDLAHHSVLPAHEEAARLEAVRGSADGQHVHVFSLWSHPDIQAGRYIPFDKARELEAAAVASRITQLLASGATVERSDGSREAIAPRHIAILSRTKINVQPVTHALLAAGVPFRLVGGVGFYDASEIRDALAWIRLLADPFDALSVARVLESPTIGASDAVLARLAAGLDRDDTAFARRVLVEDVQGDDELAAQAREAARRLRELLDALAPHAALPLLGAVRAVLELTGMERHYQDSPDSGAPQALANLEKLEALARGFVQDLPGAQPADFAAFIAELERVDFDEREADVPSYDAVTISTIHSAKGLEWPIVFVLGVWPQLRPGPRLFVDDASGALLYGEGPDGGRPFHYLAVTELVDSEGYVAASDDPARTERDGEERRLLYVAITRARDRLFISGLRGKPTKDNASGKPHKYLQRMYDWLHERGWSADEMTPHVSATPAPGRIRTGSIIRPVTLAPPAIAAAAAQTRLAAPLSYSAISQFERCPRRATYRIMLRLPEVGGFGRMRHTRRVDDKPEAQDLTADDSLLNQGDYGKVLHKALELWARAARAGDPVARAQTYVRAAGEALGLSPAQSQSLRAEQALQQVVAELGAWRPIQIEAPFMLDFGDEGDPLLVSGYLDLLATDAAGRACLVDYKTGEARGEEFSLQLALYRAAARAVYAIDDPQCFVGRVKDNGFSLEPIVTVHERELRERIVRVRDGLLARDARPRAGAWCDACGYRDAPCQDYQRPKRPKSAQP